LQDFNISRKNESWKNKIEIKQSFNISRLQYGMND